jgi:hypothetical protein
MPTSARRTLRSSKTVKLSTGMALEPGSAAGRTALVNGCQARTADVAPRQRVRLFSAERLIYQQVSGRSTST